MKFLFACGGTAGHINPAIAVAGRLGELMEGSEFLFVGAGRELENKLIAGAGYPLEKVDITGLRRSISPKAIQENAKLLRNLVVSGRESAALLKKFRPDAVIGTGGYVCYPVLKEAKKMGIPTFMHESNAVPGLTTKLLAGKVDVMMVAFPEAAKEYRHPENVAVTGTPVRRGFSRIGRAAARKQLGLGGEPLAVSFWGSLGASKMNEIMAEFLAENNRQRAFRQIHATGGGEQGRRRMMELLSSRGADQLWTGIDVRAYIDNMDVVMNAADVVLCRAGASTIAELTALGKPSVLVPSPNVTNHHQEKNAAAMGKAGGALVLPEGECTGEKLFEAVRALLSDGERLRKMEKAAAAAGAGNATDRIVEIILSRLTK